MVVATNKGKILKSETAKIKLKNKLKIMAIPNAFDV